MNKAEINKKFCEELEARDYEYSAEAVKTIVDKSIFAKKHLYEMFRKHPNWDEDQLCIHFDKDYERKVDARQYSNFLDWLWDQTVECPRPEGIEYPRMEDVYIEPETEAQKTWWGPCRKNMLDALCNIPSQPILPEVEEGTAYERDLKLINALDEKWNFRPGMKLNRVIGKICKKYGWDKIPGYDKAFAQFSDAFSALKISRHTTVSINPIDFLLMSNGNSWRSCHYIGDNPGDAGCYSSGTVSYMLDPDSFIVSLIDKSESGEDLARAPKINRQIFGYRDKQLLQSRLYPQDCDAGADAIYENIRAIVEEIIAKAEGEANRWVAKSRDELNVEHSGTCYPDWEYYRPCKRWVLRPYENQSHPRIQLGKKPICVKCGNTHEKTDNIVCESCRPVRCWDCGCELDLSDSNNYVQDGDYYYCTECRKYCDKCGCVYRPDELVHIEDIDEDWCGWCVDHNDVYQCAECGYYYTEDALTWTADTKRVCEDCLDEYYEQCWECGDWYRTEDMEEVDGHLYCEDCAEKMEESKEGENERNSA